MADTFQLEIVTPEKKVVDAAATEAQIPGKNGYLGILPGHAPLITELMIGEISYTKGGTTVYLALSWGFAEVLPDTAERAEDIDVARAQEAKTRAEEALRNPAPDLDYAATNHALRRAEVR